MRTISIVVDQSEGDSKEEHEMECLVAINGGHYYDCLYSIKQRLMEMDRKRKLEPEARQMLDTIKSDLAPFLKEVRGARHK